MPVLRETCAPYATARKSSDHLETISRNAATAFSSVSAVTPTRMGAHFGEVASQPPHSLGVKIGCILLKSGKSLVIFSSMILCIISFVHKKCNRIICLRCFT
jgi:hypothetical protein